MYSSRYQGIIYFLSQLSSLSEKLTENTTKVHMIHLNVSGHHIFYTSYDGRESTPSSSTPCAAVMNISNQNQKKNTTFAFEYIFGEQ